MNQSLFATVFRKSWRTMLFDRGGRAMGRSQIQWEQLECRVMLNSAFSLINLDDLRNDPVYSGIDGSGVSVAVIDTGIDSMHPDLRSAYRGGADFVTSDTFGPGTDPNGHGTHVSGTIAARNPGIGIATAAGIVGVNVLNASGAGTGQAVIAGITWVIDHQTEFNIRVISLSLGGAQIFTSIAGDPGDAYAPLIARAEAAGIAVISAAGNDYVRWQAQGVASPAIVSTLMVGAVTDHGWEYGITDDLARFSQRLAADNRMILAPGVEITSTYPNNRTAIMSGTSMATPAVSGIVALMQDAAMTFGGRYLTTTEVRDIVVSSGDAVNDAEHPRDQVVNSNASYRRINAYAAVQMVRARLGSGTPPPDDGSPNDLDGTSGRANTLTQLSDGSIVFNGSGKVGFDAGGVRIGPHDVDLYKFTIGHDSSLYVDVSSDTQAPADFDSYLRLFDSGGVEIAANDNHTGLFSQYSGTMAAGTYYIGVGGKGNDHYALDVPATRADGAQGNYAITILLLDLTLQDRDGTLPRANEVMAGSPRLPLRIDGSVGFDDATHPGAADVDFYRILAPDNGFVLADIDSLGSTYTDTYLRLFDSNGVELALSDDDAAQNTFAQAVEQVVSGGVMQNISDHSFAGRATDSFVRMAVTRGQIVYLAVSNYDNRNYSAGTVANRAMTGAEGAYSLFLTFSSNDVNGSIDRAVETAAPSLNSGEVGTDQSTLQTGTVDVDFSHIRLTSSQLLTVRVNSAQNFIGNASPFDSTLRLFDSAGNLLGFNDDFNGIDPQLLFYAHANTDYYLAVTGYGNDGFDPFVAGSGSGGATGDYQLQISTTSTSQFFALANDSLQYSGIQTVTPGFSGDFHLGMDSALVIGNNDVDLYKFIAPSTGLLAAYATRIDESSADTVVRLFDSTGIEITASFDLALDTRNDDTVLANVTQGQTYYIGVSGYGADALTYDARFANSAGPGSTGSYELTVGFGTLRPSIGSVNATRAMNGSRVTGMTPTVSAPGAQSVVFMVDFNRNGSFGEGEQIGTDSDPIDGLSIFMPIDQRFAPGNYLIGSVAVDAQGIPSPISSTQFDIRPNYSFRVFYPEGWANETAIDEFVPLVNPNDTAVSYRIIAHYERRPEGDAGAPLSFIVAEGTLNSHSRGGETITTRAGIGRSRVELQRGYALEVQSTLPLGATLSHYDNFNPSQPAAGVATGEALTSITSTSWFFSNVIKDPASNFEFLLFFNPNDQAASVSVTFVQNGATIANATFPVYANNRWGLAINDLPALSNGSYGVIVTSTLPILAAQSAYTTDGRGDSSIGIPGSGGLAPTSGVVPFVDTSADLTSGLTFINPGLLPITILLTARDSAGSISTTSLIVNPQSVAANNLGWVSGLTGTSYSLSYTSTGPAGVTVAQYSPSRGDSTFYPAMSQAALTWAVADAFLNRPLAGSRYFENLTIFNPSATATTVSVDYLLYDRSQFTPPGQSDRITQSYQIAAGSSLTIALHAPDSLVMTFDQLPNVWFSVVTRGTVPIYTEFTHWDLNQGGGWDSWASPVG